MAEQEALTLGEACRSLRISRKALTKWCKRLGIEPTRHAYDYRFFTISAEDLQRIKDARAQMPGAEHINKPLYVALRGESDGLGYSDASPSVAPTPRQRPLQRATVGALPDGMMAKEDASRLHGVPTSTLRRWCQEGRIETHEATYAGEHGRYGIVNPITARGLAQFYALASGRPDFTPCAQCPHDSGGDAPEAAAAETPEE